MKLIVGLGNPGSEYEKTRHNVGFMIVDKYVDTFNKKIGKKKFNALYEELIIDNEKVIIVKPQEYMNLSGQAISKFINFYKINIDDVLIIYDDMDIEFGKLKLKLNGSSAGHNGIKSIISNLGTENFKRLKIGIGKNKLFESKNFVLGKFTKEELNIVDEICNKSIEILNEFTKEDFIKIMSRYN